MRSVLLAGQARTGVVAHGGLVVDNRLPAGNIVVEKIDGDTVHVTPTTCRDLGRDTAKVFRALLDEKPCIDGIYPHLVMFNREGECGTAAQAYWFWRTLKNEFD